MLAILVYTSFSVHVESLNGKSQTNKQEAEETTTATATKTSLKKRSRAASNFIALIPSRSICRMLAIFSGAEFYKTVSKFRKRKRMSSSCGHVLHKT